MGNAARPERQNGHSVATGRDVSRRRFCALGHPRDMVARADLHSSLPASRFASPTRPPPRPHLPSFGIEPQPGHLSNAALMILIAPWDSGSCVAALQLGSGVTRLEAAKRAHGTAPRRRAPAPPFMAGCAHAGADGAPGCVPLSGCARQAALCSSSGRIWIYGLLMSDPCKATSATGRRGRGRGRRGGGDADRRGTLNACPPVATIIFGRIAGMSTNL